MKKIILGIVFLLVVGIVSAPVPNPGHSPSEIDWSQQISGGLKVSSNVGIGTASPTVGYALDVYGGGIKFEVGGSGGKITFGTPATETGLAMGINNRADIRFDDSTLKLVVATGTSAPSSTNGIAIATSGNVGIGTNSPGAKLHVAGSMKIDGANTLEFGAGVAGKEANAGKIGYRTFTADALDVIGAGTLTTNRKIKFWNEGGASFRGSVGIGTDSPGDDKLDVRGRAYASGGWQTTDADYAEWFEKEENTKSGDLIGINLETGKARKYRRGDKFIGIHSSTAGIVGNRLKESEEEMSKTHVLVGLLGQLDFNREQVIVNSRIVKTSDGTYVGVLLSNGKVLLGR